MKSKKPDPYKLALRLAHNYYMFGFWAGRAKAQKIEDYKVIVELDKQNLLNCLEEMKNANS
jgi:hypothetical protein